MMRSPSGMKGAPCRSESGYTLIELLVVSAIISVLVVAFGASFMGWREKYRAESDVKAVYAALMDSKIRALKEKRYFFVNMPASNQYLIRIYKDTDPAPMGDGVLDITKDQQVGPDIMLNNELEIMAKYREFWFNGQGMLMHSYIGDETQRDFQIRMRVWDTDNPEMYISAQADYNCLLVNPPFYFNGGIWNATVDQEKDSSNFRNLDVQFNRSDATVGNVPLCQVK